MIKIEIRTDNSSHTIERQDANPVQALDDLLNLLFISNTDVNEIQKAIIETADKIKKDHKNESKVQNTCSI